MANAGGLSKRSDAATSIHVLHAWRRRLARTTWSRVRSSTATHMHHSHLKRRSLLSLRGNVEACNFLRQCQAVMQMRRCSRIVHAWREVVAESHVRRQAAQSLGNARKRRIQTDVLQHCWNGLKRWAASQRNCRMMLCQVCALQLWLKRQNSFTPSSHSVSNPGQEFTVPMRRTCCCQLSFPESNSPLRDEYFHQVPSLQVLKRYMHVAFSQWAHTTLKRSTATHLLAMHLFRILRLSFARWAHHTFTRSGASQLLSRRLQKVQTHSFTHWRIVAAGRRYRTLHLCRIRTKLAAQPSTLAVTAEHALRRLRVGSAAASAFSVWHTLVASKRAHLARAVHALQHMGQLNLRYAFHAWRKCVECLTRNQLQGIRLEGLVCGDLVETTLHTWREAAQVSLHRCVAEATASSHHFNHVARVV